MSKLAAAVRPRTLDSELGRQRLGLTLFALGMSLGGCLLVVGLLLPPLRSSDPGARLREMALAAVLAFPAAAAYLTVPRLLDRFDPEPWYALLACLSWGAVAACGFSGFVNSLARVAATAAWGDDAGLITSVVVSAPLAEELFKGMAVLGVFWFLRREFDGVVDGIIYATFTAIGFATVENVYYYSQAALDGSEVLYETFRLRGLQTPWLHPLFTSVFGASVGVSRETTRAWVRRLAPALGFVLAVLLHATWNGIATFEGFDGAPWVSITLPAWLLGVAAFFAIVVALVRRRGRIIGEYLEDEIHIGTLSRDEVELVCHPLGLWRAGRAQGEAGVRFVRAAARLALSKWHVTRARKSKLHTVSGDFVAPLRRQIAQLRAEAYATH